MLELEFKDEPLWWQARGLSYTRSGYGDKIPTTYKALYKGRWYRVYCRIYSNVGTVYIVSEKKEIAVRQKV